jgi:2-hydroxy-3-keto-5-methylthiopentenyl-1-phosphate phosphatase
MVKYKLALLCDFDGTVAKGDVGHRIYTRFGNEGWEEINKRWRKGEISSKECLIGEYNLMDATEDEVREYIMDMEIDPGFIELVETCKENDIPIAIVSDGFDFYIHAILEKYGLCEIETFCNNLIFNGRKIELSFPYYELGCGKCGNCKVLHVDNLKEDGRTVIYIGDGLSDRYASQASDVIFAKDELMSYLENNDIKFNKFSGLSDVNNWLIELLGGSIDLPKSSCESDPDCENKGSKQVKNVIKNLKMKKTKKDMGDGRYIIYYDWTE